MRHKSFLLLFLSSLLCLNSVYAVKTHEDGGSSLSPVSSATVAQSIANVFGVYDAFDSTTTTPNQQATATPVQIQPLDPATLAIVAQRAAASAAALDPTPVVNTTTVTNSTVVNTPVVSSNITTTVVANTTTTSTNATITPSAPTTVANTTTTSTNTTTATPTTVSSTVTPTPTPTPAASTVPTQPAAPAAPTPIDNSIPPTPTYSFTFDSANVKGGEIGSGISWLESSGPYQGVLQFNGTSSSYVKLPNLQFGDNSFTLRVIANPSDYSKWARFFDCGVSSKVNKHANNLMLSRASSQPDLGIWSFQDRAKPDTSSIASGSLKTNEWYDIIVTHDVKSKVTRTYVNSQLVSIGYIYTPSLFSRDQCFLGKSLLATDNIYYNGLMDRIELWDKYVMSQKFIDNIYVRDCGCSKTAAPLSSLYKPVTSSDSSSSTVPASVPKPTLEHDFLTSTHPNLYLGSTLQWSESEEGHSGVYKFDGSRSSYVGLEPISFGGSDVTIRIVAKVDADTSQSLTTTQWQRFFDCGNGQDLDTVVLTRVANTTDALFHIRRSDTGEAPQNAYRGETFTGLVLPGQWQDIVISVTRDGVAEIFVNGARAGYATYLWTIPAMSRRSCFLGRSNWLLDSNFRGSIDKFQLWDGELLSLNQVKDLYKADGGIFPTFSDTELSADYSWRGSAPGTPKPTFSLTFDNPSKQSDLYGLGTHATWQAGSGPYKGVIALDGQPGSYIHVAPFFAGGGDVTFRIVAKPTAVTRMARFFDCAGPNVDADAVYLSRVDVDTQVLFGVHAGQTINGRYTSSPRQLRTGHLLAVDTWYDLVIAIGANGDTSIYRDGKLVTGGKTWSPNRSARGHCFLGRSNFYQDQHFAGLIDKFQVWDGVKLSPAQVNEVYRYDLKPSCSLNHGGCDSKSSCILQGEDVWSDPFCGDCPTGYSNLNSNNKTKCADTNECAAATNPCQLNVPCTNIAGGYTCAPCPAGYVGDAKAGTCKDVNECAESNGGCDPQTKCVNTPGSFTCGDCPTGFVDQYAEATRSLCIDVNECLGVNPCQYNVTCSNEPGSYRCARCPDGFKGDAKAMTCKDVDECATNNGGCDKRTQCINTAGSFQCGECPAGYKTIMISGKLSFCQDIDECVVKKTPCQYDVKCTNIDGSYTCASCPAGYEGDAKLNTCKDIDECTAPLSKLVPTNDSVANALAVAKASPCDSLTRCLNKAGSYECTPCPPGYKNTATDGITTKCEDVDECVLGTHNCHSLQKCNNTIGSFICGACPTGYKTVGNVCEDIDECTNPLYVNGGCDVRTTCKNTKGGRICGPCPDGYLGNGDSECQDIDECSTGTSGCDQYTTCTNKPGSYECSPCPSGFENVSKDPKKIVCKDVDECVKQVCDPATTCTNTLGGFKCSACPIGYIDVSVNPKNPNQTDPLYPKCQDVNECLVNNGGCGLGHKCTNTIGSWRCEACADGYQDINGNCTDIDECLANNGGCDPRSKCINTAGSRTCGDCPAGWYGTGNTNCQDVDECAATKNGGCDELSTCYNTPGKFSCSDCPNGYLTQSRDGIVTCVDIDECAKNNGGCDPSVVCTNTKGSFKCGNCKPGFLTVNGTCIDIDECASDNGKCDKLTNCTNTLGSRTCTACPAGYQGTGETGCQDIDECSTNNGGCDRRSSCINSPGSFRCGPCITGYYNNNTVGALTVCADVNECATNNGGCDPLSQCLNFEGSFRCLDCPAGYNKVSAVNGTGFSCKDINECLINNGGCDVATNCTNTPGSRTCGSCPPGYTGNAEVGCYDVNECLVNNGGCDLRVMCNNTQGSRTCGACPVGYSGDGVTGCVDVDECRTNNGGCDAALTTCINTPGSFRCSNCPSGYNNTSPDPRLTKCQDIDECANNNGGCDRKITCLNFPGSYVCGDCPLGYLKASSGCQDVDECLTNNGGCDRYSNCTNTGGSRTCGPCPAGFSGDGVTGCKDINECLTNNGGCDKLTNCTNTEGSRFCSACPVGYKGTGDSSCVDIDECATNRGGCDPVSTCVNTPGSFLCTPCPVGYLNISNPLDSRLFACKDINECDPFNPCQFNVQCNNTAGSYICASCPSGYIGDAKLRTCQDVNECNVTWNGGCDNATTCTNLPGSFRCSACPSGFLDARGNSDSPYSKCTDINECLTGNGGCSSLANCTNTPGSRICGACPSGYSGNGINCTDIDECLTSNGGCDKLTNCTNTLGSRTCSACPKGYTGSGDTQCKDIDECASNNGGCHALSVCTNTPGSRTCGPCPQGFTGTGETECRVRLSEDDPTVVADYIDLPFDEDTVVLGVVPFGDAHWEAGQDAHLGVMALGQNGYISFNPTTIGDVDWSVRFWINIQAAGTMQNNARLLHFSNDNSTDGIILMRSGTSDDLSVRIVTRTGTVSELIVPGVLTSFKWTDIAIAQNGVAGTLSVYKNGALVVSKDMPRPHIIKRKFMMIGKCPDCTNVPTLNANIDRFSLWVGKYLSADVIAQLNTLDSTPPCEKNNGGCDALVPCIPNKNNAFLPPTCGDCPETYVTVTHKDATVECIPLSSPYSIPGYPGATFEEFAKKALRQ